MNYNFISYETEAERIASVNSVYPPGIKDPRGKQLRVRGFTRWLFSAPGGLLEEDEDRAHDACGLLAGLGVKVTVRTPVPTSTWEQLISVVYQGFCCPCKTLHPLKDRV